MNVDLSPTILDLAQGRAWQLLMVGDGSGQFVAGGTEERWRRWVAEHTNGERASVLTALREAVRA